MILVTGGAGFIGSHTCIELLNKGYEVLIVDNFSNSKPDIINKIMQITNKEVTCINVDVNDKIAMNGIFEQYQIDSVIHFAGLKAVGESIQIPLTYYRTNIDSILTLCEIMKANNVRKLIFSSSATIYNDKNIMPLEEDGVLGCTNPYGWTKYMIEQILKDLYVSDNRWAIALLRYFNPIGAHSSGLIGEDPNGIPNNLLPYISKVATRKLDVLHVFGNDYPTIDGTGVRDYIHVVDLAKGHISALEFINKNHGVEPINLGTGKGYSVLEVIKAFEIASGQKIPYVIDQRRAGDIATCFASPQKAFKLLNWQAEYDLQRMCSDAWNFEKKALQEN